MPRYLVKPYMIWGILGVGLLSQINLMLLAKLFSSNYYAKGYPGFVQLFGKNAVRFFTFLGLFPILVKIDVLTLGVGEVVHQYIFPSMNSNWLLLSIFLVCFYVAVQGMEKTIRFVVIVFLSTIWMLIIFCPFFFPPIASLHDLYPLIPHDWSGISWSGLLLVWTSMSGPEMLVYLAPWLSPKQKMLKYLTIANTISTLEYLLLFTAALLFFGSNYLDKTRFPVLDMIRYLQFPAYERIDIVLISLHMFVLVFVNSILMLLFYGAIRILMGKGEEQTTLKGFTASLLIIFVSSLIINQWFWKSGGEQNIWMNLQIGVGAFTYFLVPTFLLVATKLKGCFKA
ncbi:GerAB/ArcD/ProY family transporter [Desulfosporosinus sp. Sb-LF]|uniref:GerAB/ArcD/ProY family transporter n=1 Tax=Desulfosporosinus sp. Sb-LF TaxID=2560027 RepID=UPI001FB195C1|nr:GerAB/ArcD/ProY family transporter [Desulfosporosinus sp. Sb-LF]